LQVIQHANVGGEPTWMRPAARHPAKIPLLTLTALVALGLAAPAVAQDAGVDITVSAVIADRCGFARLAPTPLRGVTPDLETAQTFSVSLPLDCNTPFAVGVRGENGRLVNVTSRPDGSGYAFDKTYGVRLTLETSEGDVRSERCASDQIVAGGTCGFASDQPGRGLGSGGGVATPGAVTLTIDWPDQSTLNQRLAAGDYSDTITLVVGARA
jgi:hypothetical protein